VKRRETQSRLTHGTHDDQRTTNEPGPEPRSGSLAGEEAVVGIAVSPGLPDLARRDDGMLRRAVVRGGVVGGRRVAAPDVPARQADAGRRCRRRRRRVAAFVVTRVLVTTPTPDLSRLAFDRGGGGAPLRVLRPMGDSDRPAAMATLTLRSTSDGSSAMRSRWVARCGSGFLGISSERRACDRRRATHDGRSADVRRRSAGRLWCSLFALIAFVTRARDPAVNSRAALPRLCLRPS
jgi:hypothetical protein